MYMCTGLPGTQTSNHIIGSWPVNIISPYKELLRIHEYAPDSTSIDLTIDSIANSLCVGVTFWRIQYHFNQKNGLLPIVWQYSPEWFGPTCQVPYYTWALCGLFDSAQRLHYKRWRPYEVGSQRKLCSQFAMLPTARQHAPRWMPT